MAEKDHGFVHTEVAECRATPFVITTESVQTAIRHWSDCAVYNAPALPVGPCDCGGIKD